MLRERRFVAAGADGTLNWQGRLFWLGVASASFHLAYVMPGGAFLMGVYVFGLFQLLRQKTRFQTMNTGWALSFLVYAPHLSFFWTIVGPAAAALWLVLGFWLGLFLALVRFVRAKVGHGAAALAAPFLWTGLEYFRSELYYLRFSWLNVGYAFAWADGWARFAWLGVYGVGAFLMAVAAGIAQLPPRRGWLVGLGALLMLALLTNLPRRIESQAGGRTLRVAGMQLE